MTKEEAIKIIDPETSKEAIAGYGPEPAKRIAVSQALGMAISALRDQQTPLDEIFLPYMTNHEGKTLYQAY